MGEYRGLSGSESSSTAGRRYEVEGDAPPAVERENSLGEKIGNA